MGAIANRDQLAKDAAKAVINTLVVGDYIGVVYFSTSASYLGTLLFLTFPPNSCSFPFFSSLLFSSPSASSPSLLLLLGGRNLLVPASKANVASLLADIDSLQPGGNTNYEAAFEFAFNMLAKYEREEG